MKCMVVLASLGVLIGGCRTPVQRTAIAALPRAFEPSSYANCYNGVGFFRVSKAEVDRLVPDGFTARDGSIMGPEHKGYGVIALIYYSCPRAGGGEDGLAIVATPIADPSFVVDLRAVRWNWYEFGRLVDSRERVEELRSRGLSAQAATFSHRPFREGDTESSFVASVEGGQLFAVRAVLTDSVNFEAQSHRLWHRRPDGRLVSTRLDFAYHHSWIGRFASCSFHSRLLAVVDLSPIECTGAGVTEAIESLSFKEQVILWR